MTTPENEKKVLIVDDELDLLVLLKKVVSKRLDCLIEIASSGTDALEKLTTFAPDVLLTDIKMPDMDGLELLGKTKDIDPTISTIIMTGYGTIEMAVQAIKNGAYDFFEKPFDNDLIVRAVERALERTRLVRENLHLQDRLNKDAPLDKLIGHTSQMIQTKDLLSRFAESDATVLIRGQSGTGKELAARMIHGLSKRYKQKMVAVNCPALPEQILESELFGYKKGAFTGADTDKDGLFIEADGSTILLDEIGDIPISIQTKLLRVLQEKEIQPLGQTKSFSVDVRVIASTNQNLEEKMRSGEFREDLFYRLNVMSITMPALNEISEDIPSLAAHFLSLFKHEYNKKALEFTPDSLQWLMDRHWQGNVRELQNVINRATLLSSGKTVSIEDLDETSNIKELSTPPDLSHPKSYNKLSYNQAKKEFLSSFTTSYLSTALTKTYGNVTAAAKLSGIERQTFQRLMRQQQLLSIDFRDQ